VSPSEQMSSSVTQHGYATRSKTKRARTILASQTFCPISLEPFDKDTLVFTHNLAKFDALQLRDFLIASPGSLNPVNRAKFTDEDLDLLQKMCAGRSSTRELLRGNAAERAKAEQLAEANNIFFL
jgi:hypothetical protein